jgi:HNH endonuclease
MARDYLSLVLRKRVNERANYCCEYCKSQASYSTETRFAVEHIIPLSSNGSSEVDNLALSCSGCNGYKYDKTEAVDPATREQVALFHPRKQNWQEHFAWSADYATVLGLTPTGRATVEALKINRVGLVNMRRLLYSAGKHPPNMENEV